jgi:hypothetical protein
LVSIYCWWRRQRTWNVSLCISQRKEIVWATHVIQHLKNTNIHGTYLNVPPTRTLVTERTFLMRITSDWQNIGHPPWTLSDCNPCRRWWNFQWSIHMYYGELLLVPICCRLKVFHGTKWLADLKVHCVINRKLPVCQVTPASFDLDHFPHSHAAYYSARRRRAPTDDDPSKHQCPKIEHKSPLDSI